METVSKTALVLGLALTFAAAPVTVDLASDSSLSVKPALAMAKGGDDGDSDGGGNSGHSGGGDDGGHGSGGDDGGRDGDDSSGHGRGGDDDSADDSSGRGRGRGRGADDGPTHDAHEVTFSDGSRIEIENGRFERKDANGRTIEERPATAADRALLANARVQQTPAAAPARSNARGGGVVAKLETTGVNIEITYTDGWKEEIENGRYELKDANNNTVIERRATNRDVTRLFDAVR